MPTNPHQFSTHTSAIYYALTPVQRAYVDARLKGEPPRTAAHLAGYAKTSARALSQTELEQHPAIKTILRETGRAALKNLCLTREHVLHGLLDAVDTSATATELTNAWREIGRVIGAYEPDKVQIDTSNIEPESLRTMSIVELAALAEMQGIFDEIPRKLYEDAQVVEAEFSEIATESSAGACEEGGDGEAGEGQGDGEA